MAKGTLRIAGPKHEVFPEGTIPMIVVNQVQLYCHNEVTEEDEDGDEMSVKMRPTAKFMTKLNELVADILDEAIQGARGDGRTELMESDVPSFDEDEDE